MSTIDDLEKMLAERDATIEELREDIAKLRTDLAKSKYLASQYWMEVEKIRKDVAKVLEILS